MKLIDWEGSINSSWAKEYKENEELTKHMKTEGMKYPIKVIKTHSGNYLIVEGFLRFISARSLEWKHIRARIINNGVFEDIATMRVDSND